jgi:hypothetical protein
LEHLPSRVAVARCRRAQKVGQNNTPLILFPRVFFLQSMSSHTAAAAATAATEPDDGAAAVPDSEALYVEALRIGRQRDMALFVTLFETLRTRVRCRRIGDRRPLAVTNVVPRVVLDMLAAANLHCNYYYGSGGCHCFASIADDCSCDFRRKHYLKPCKPEHYK